MRQVPRPSEVEFGPMNDLAEMARIASSYTARLTPEKVRLTRIGRFVWLRLDVRSQMKRPLRSNPRSTTRSNALDLVFCLSTDSPRPLPFIHPLRDFRAATPPQTT